MNLQQWLQQGEALYQGALKEFQAMESQLDDLEGRLVAKLAEVNQIASVLGKSPVDSNRRLNNGHAGSTQVISAAPIEDSERSIPTPSSANSIARALTGKFGR
jgi:hypothetical protein